MYGQNQSVMMMPPTPKRKSCGECQCAATTALIFMLVFALVELTLFSLLGVYYFTINGCDGGVRYRNNPLNIDMPQLDIRLARGTEAQAVRETREMIGGILFPAFIVCVLMVLFTTINMCLCCCARSKMYYGTLMVTGLVILIGSIVMCSLGIQAEAPGIIKQAVANNARAESDLKRITDGVHLAFWIILAVNGTFGLWILLLAILKFCSSGQDDEEERDAFVPVQLSNVNVGVTPTAAPATGGAARGMPGGTRGYGLDV